MVMPGRKYPAASGVYRYGFNGKENDKDINNGAQDYGNRIYDGRITKFLSVDPLTNDYPYYSPYQYAGNSPIELIDIDGSEGGKEVSVTDKIYKSINDFTDAVSDFLTFKSEREDIIAGVNNMAEGANKQALGPWNAWQIYNSENPDLAIAYRKTDGYIQGVTGVVQVSSGVQGISNKVQTVVEVPLILKDASQALLKKGTSNAVKGSVKPEASAPATSTYKMTDNVPEWKGPLTYDHLPEPRKVGPYLKTTPTQRNKILDYNKKMNGGNIRSDIDGSIVDKPIKTPKGAKANMNEAQIDHIKERVNGGSNSNKNQRVASKQQNMDKEMERRKTKNN
jgi:RHS repeat-associated protein